MQVCISINTPGFRTITLPTLYMNKMILFNMYLGYLYIIAMSWITAIV